MSENDEIKNLQFNARKIKWYAEDLEKMKTMSAEERMNYKRYLKQNNKYTYEE